MKTAKQISMPMNEVMNVTVTPLWHNCSLLQRGRMFVPRHFSS